MTHDHEPLESHQSFQLGRVITRVIKCDDSSIPYSRREITALIDDDNWKAVAEAVDTVGENRLEVVRFLNNRNCEPRLLENNRFFMRNWTTS